MGSWRVLFCGRAAGRGGRMAARTSSAAARLVRRRPLHLLTGSVVPRRRTAMEMQASLRPLLTRVATAWNPVPARYMSLLQELYGDDATTADGDAAADGGPSGFEKLTVRAAAGVGLDNFATDVLPALKVLAESLQMIGESGAIQNWTTSDWLLGLTVLAQHNTVQRKKTRPPRMAAASPSITANPEDRRTLIAELLRFVRISDAVYADTIEQFCEEAKLPPETIVRSFNGGILSPKFILLRNDATSEIVLTVRGTASILDFCTDICLINEPFADGQGHRGMVHAARWLVKNVREDLERLTAEYPQYKLMITGHSLGAGVSALAAMELKPQFPHLKCIAFATPASVTENVAESCEDYVTTVVNGDDCVPRLHQHSMRRLQGEVSEFDWRTTLKQMVDEEIEEQKTMVKQKRDKHLQDAYEAFQSMKAAQEEQAMNTLTQVLQTPVGRRVSASFELSKAAFWTDQPAMERLASVKQVVLKQKHSGDDKKLWESLEATVTGLESLAGALSRPQDLQAILTKSKLLLATSTMAPTTTEGEQEDALTGKSLDFSVFRDRVKSVFDQTKQTLQAEVTETIKDVSETVTASVHIIKNDVDAAIDAQVAKFEESVDAIQSEVRRGTESIVKQTQETALGVAALGPLLKEVKVSDSAKDSLEYGDGGGVDADEHGAMLEIIQVDGSDQQEETTPGLTADTQTESSSSTPPEQLHEPLFPPGRILYLNRLLHEEEAAEDAVELLHVTNDEFSRVVLSNRMILDHLCTTYERVLQATARGMEERKASTLVQQDP